MERPVVGYGGVAESALLLGAGVNRLNGATLDSCFDHGRLEKTHFPRRSEFTPDATIVCSPEELFNYFGINNGAQRSFRIAELQQRPSPILEMLEDIRFAPDRIIVATQWRYVSHDESVQLPVPPKSTPWAQDAPDYSSDTAAFVEICGDDYISGFSLGASFAVVYEFQLGSVNVEGNRLSNSDRALLAANHFTFGKNWLNDTDAQFVDSTNAIVRCMTWGGNTNPCKEHLKLGDIGNSAQEFLKTAEGHWAPLNLELTPYHDIANYAKIPHIMGGRTETSVRLQQWIRAEHHCTQLLGSNKHTGK